MVAIEAQEADWVKMGADLRKELVEGPHDSKVESCRCQDVVLASFCYARTSHHQTQNPRSATLAGSKVGGD